MPDCIISKNKFILQISKNTAWCYKPPSHQRLRNISMLRVVLLNSNYWHRDKFLQLDVIRYTGFRKIIN